MSPQSHALPETRSSPAAGRTESMGAFPPRGGASSADAYSLPLPKEKQSLLDALCRYAKLWPVESGDHFFQNPSTYETPRSRLKEACGKTNGVVRYGGRHHAPQTLPSLCDGDDSGRRPAFDHRKGKVLSHTVVLLENTYAHILDGDTRIGLAASTTWGPRTPATGRMTPPDTTHRTTHPSAFTVISLYHLRPEGFLYLRYSAQNSS